MARANLGGRRTAVENRVSRRRRRREGQPELPEEITLPLSRYVRNIPVADPFRYDEYTHVSDLVHKCMRMVALAGDLHMPVPVEPNWQSMKLIHAMGQAAHDYIKGTVIGQEANVFGHWKCLCGNRIGPMTRSEAFELECEDCGNSFVEYDEFTIHNEEYKIVGNCDLAIKSGDFLILSELKSISKKQFDDLRMPKPDHVLQAYLYVWMAEQAGYRVHPTGSIFYACREWMIGNPYREFDIDTSSAERRCTPLLDEAMAIKNWKDDGVVPERVHCNRPEDSRARQCGMCVACFS